MGLRLMGGRGRGFVRKLLADELNPIHTLNIANLDSRNDDLARLYPKPAPDQNMCSEPDQNTSSDEEAAESLENKVCRLERQMLRLRRRNRELEHQTQTMISPLTIEEQTILSAAIVSTQATMVDLALHIGQIMKSGHPRDTIAAQRHSGHRMQLLESLHDRLCPGIGPNDPPSSFGSPGVEY